MTNITPIGIAGVTVQKENSSQNLFSMKVGAFVQRSMYAQCSNKGGEHVQAYWPPDRSFYAATVMAVRNNSIQVRFEEDGEERWLRDHQIKSSRKEDLNDDVLSTTEMRTEKKSMESKAEWKPEEVQAASLQTLQSSSTDLNDDVLSTTEMRTEKKSMESKAEWKPEEVQAASLQTIQSSSTDLNDVPTLNWDELFPIDGYTNIVITSEPLSEENENISEIQEDSDSSLFTDKGSKRKLITESFQYESGEHVQAYWPPDRSFYAATVMAVRNNSIQVRFEEDGEERWLRDHQIKSSRKEEMRTEKKSMESKAEWKPEEVQAASLQTLQSSSTEMRTEKKSMESKAEWKPEEVQAASLQTVLSSITTSWRRMDPSSFVSLWKLFAMIKQNRSMLASAASGCHLNIYADAVKEHKTRSKFVCNLSMDQALYSDLQCWVRCKNQFLKDADIPLKPSGFLFCDPEGNRLKSNYMAGIAKRAVGGSVTEMRMAQYYIVSC
ncbi:hypothetical protein CAPTEDRAFT_216006 [Capitella teleta]|uniref:Tudor domain-containing protein n=1 Tax=Capitella teleta TaxID=283909 RepID=R7UFK6_CAPTE|nr:hypothetical protein CAPTEDRAFT_216006 [Capitella teleta]|eukprot:ELU02568.1 hypothetical protein CAPTEDRAFT_216006 [Capitella teleta]